MTFEDLKRYHEESIRVLRTIDQFTNGALYWKEVYISTIGKNNIQSRLRREYAKKMNQIYCKMGETLGLIELKRLRKDFEEGLSEINDLLSKSYIELLRGRKR